MQSCLGVVLAGGLSSRMGQNKAYLTPPNSTQTMLEYSKIQLNAAGINQVIESLNFKDKENSGEQIADQWSNLGPLGGIATVFERKTNVTGYLFLPIDLPLLTTPCLQQLKTHGELTQQACHFSNHFLPLYLPRNAFTEMFFNKLSLEKGQVHSSSPKKDKGLSIKAMLKQVPHQEISLAPHESHQLFNCNTPAQWQQVQQQFKTRVS